MNTAQRPQNTCTRRPCDFVWPCSIKQSATDYNAHMYYLVYAHCGNRPNFCNFSRADCHYANLQNSCTFVLDQGKRNEEITPKKAHSMHSTHSTHMHETEWDTTELHLRAHRSSTRAMQKLLCTCTLYINSSSVPMIFTIANNTLSARLIT